MTRKSPIKHKVKRHTRKNRTVRPHSRGKGNRPSSRLVIRRKITTKNNDSWFKERIAHLIKEAKSSYDFFRKHDEYGENHILTKAEKDSYDMTKSLRVVPYPFFTGKCLHAAHKFSIKNKVLVGRYRGEKGYMCPYDGSGIVTKEGEKKYEKFIERFSKKVRELKEKLEKEERSEKECVACENLIAKYGGKPAKTKSSPNYKILDPEKNPLLDYAEVKVDMSCQKDHFYMQGSGCFKVISSGKLICSKCGKPLFKSQRG